MVATLFYVDGILVHSLVFKMPKPKLVRRADSTERASGLLKYFNTTSWAEYLEQVKHKNERQAELQDELLELGRLREVQKQAHKRVVDRTRKQRLRARQKRVSDLDTLEGYLTEPTGPCLTANATNLSLRIRIRG
jgi:hypothetical protein